MGRRKLGTCFQPENSGPEEGASSQMEGRAPDPSLPCPPKQEAALGPSPAGGASGRTAEPWAVEGLGPAPTRPWRPGQLTALKKFRNLCSSKPAASRSFGVCSTRSLNLKRVD